MTREPPKAKNRPLACSAQGSAACGRDAAVFAWSDLILDRSRKLVGLQSPAACATRAGGDSGPNSENYDFFHAQRQSTASPTPDTGRGVHARRSWRPNRGIVVRR